MKKLHNFNIFLKNYINLLKKNKDKNMDKSALIDFVNIHTNMQSKEVSDYTSLDINNAYKNRLLDIYYLNLENMLIDYKNLNIKYNNYNKNMDYLYSSKYYINRKDKDDIIHNYLNINLSRLNTLLNLDKNIRCDANYENVDYYINSDFLSLIIYPSQNIIDNYKQSLEKKIYPSKESVLLISSYNQFLNHA